MLRKLSQKLRSTQFTLSFFPSAQYSLFLTNPNSPQYYFSSSKPPAYNKQQIQAILKDVNMKSQNLTWKFVRGGGKGGQKVNKTNNCVILTHDLTGIQVKVHRSRDLETNKNLAIRNLKVKLDNFLNGNESKQAKKNEKRRRNKSRNRRRSRLKHQNAKNNSNKKG